MSESTFNVISFRRLETRHQPSSWVFATHVTLEKESEGTSTCYSDNDGDESHQKQADLLLPHISRRRITMCPSCLLDME